MTGSARTCADRFNISKTVIPKRGCRGRMAPDGSLTGTPGEFMLRAFLFFSHLGQHHFFIIFSSPIFLDFASIWVPNLEPKSMKNRSRGRYFRRLKLHRAIFRNLKDVSHGMHGFRVPRPPEKLPKSNKNREKSYIEVYRLFDNFLNYFFIGF